MALLFSTLNGPFSLLDSHEQGVESLSICQQWVVTVGFFQDFVASEDVIAYQFCFAELLEVLRVIDNETTKIDVVASCIQATLAVNPGEVSLFLDILNLLVDLASH